MTILKDLKELQQIWKDQDFHYTGEQKEKYNTLLNQRRERVKYFYDNNLVSKGRPSSSSTSGAI